MNWKDEAWLVLDTETTGPDTNTDKIVQIGTAWMRHGEVQSRQVSYVNPGVAIPADSTAVHGITDEMVADARPFAEEFSTFLMSLRLAPVIVGYNLLGFDWPIIEREAEEAGALGDLVAATDTAFLVDALVNVKREAVGKWWRGKGRHRLTNVAERLRIAIPGGETAHQADTDAYLCGRILWATQASLPDDATACAEILAIAKAEQDEERRAWENGERDKWLARKGKGTA